MKKIIALLCTVVMLSASVTAVSAADAENTSDKFLILSELGIDTTPASGYATKDYFIAALMGFFYDEGYKPEIEEFARVAEIVKFGEIYKGSENLTVGDALEYAAIALGYKGYAENGSYGNIIGNLGLRKGLSGTEDELVTVQDCKTILYNMLECEPVISTISGNQVLYQKAENETLLSKYRDIVYFYGKVTGDEYTSLTKEEGCDEGYILIDNTEYKYDSEDGAKLLGKNVEVYARRDKSDTPSILHISERKNKNTEITIDAKDIENISEDYSELYYVEGEKTKTLKITAVPKVIYNGVFDAKYQHSDFKPECGSIRAIDNNTDGRYDVIFISSYKTMIVQATDSYKKTIYNKYNVEEYDYTIELEPEDGEIRYHITNGMSELAFTDIKAADILSIAESKSEENKMIEIVVSKENVSGKVSVINQDEMIINIDGVEYDFIQAFNVYSNAEKRDLNIGVSYTFYLDGFGNVVCRIASPEDGYAIAYKFNEDEIASEYSLTYMNMDGAWITAPLAKNVYADDIKLNAEETFKQLMNVRGQIVKIKTNAAGEIKRIETATESAKYEPNKFTRTTTTEYTWRSALKSFDCNYFLEDNAKVVVIPADVTDKDAYQIRVPGDYFTSDKKYTVSFYDIDEYNFTGIVSMAYAPRLNNTLLIVKSVNTICLNDEVLDEIVGCTSDYEDITVVGKDDTVFDGISAGDVIKISLNGLGRADEKERVYRLRNEFIPKTVTTIYTTTGEVAGTVTMIDAAKGRMQMNCAGTKYNFRIDSTTKVIKYDTKYNDATVCNYMSIMPGDQLFIRLQWGKVQDVIIRK